MVDWLPEELVAWRGKTPQTGLTRNELTCIRRGDLVKVKIKSRNGAWVMVTKKSGRIYTGKLEIDAPGLKRGDKIVFERKQVVAIIQKIRRPHYGYLTDCLATE
jgi:hypothetical protein